MRRLMGAFLACALVLVACAWQRDSVAKEAAANDETDRVTMNYLLSDLPVWTLEKKFDPSVVMQLIQATISPRDWEAKGGESTMAAYPQNASVVISTRPRNHDKIKDLLVRMRD